MSLIAFVGSSGAGKTTLVRAVIAELARRGRTVGVVKHCGHGFDLGGPDKDSSRLLEAGASAVLLAGPGRKAVVAPSRRRDGDARLAGGLPPDIEIVLVEAGRTDPGIPRIEVVGPDGRRRARRASDGEPQAVVSPARNARGEAVFDRRTVKGIADMIDKSERRVGGRIRLVVDGRAVPLNPFVRSFLERTVRGMIGALDGVPRRPRTIGLTIQGGQGR